MVGIACDGVAGAATYSVHLECHAPLHATFAQSLRMPVQAPITEGAVSFAALDPSGSVRASHTMVPGDDGGRWTPEELGTGNLTFQAQATEDFQGSFALLARCGPP